MLKVIYGNEPYCIEQCKKAIQKGITNLAFNYNQIYGEFSESVSDMVYTMPFLENRRVVVLICDSLKELDNKMFYHLLENPVESTDMLIIVKSYDQRLKIAKRLKNKEVVFPCNKYSNMDDFSNAVVKACSEYKAKITKDAIVELEKRTGYLSMDGVNFLDVCDWLRKMSATTTEITLSIVTEMVPQKEEPNVFALAALIQKKQYGELQKNLSLIPAEDSIRVLSLLLREYRIAYKATMFSYSEIGITNSVFAGTSEKELLSALSIINGTIAKIKTGTMTPEQALQYATAMLIA